MQQALLAEEELFLNCLASKLMTYAIGRELGLADRQQVQLAVRHLQENGKTLRSLIEHIVTSDLFLTK